MTAVLISLLASICWGCADFAGGLYSRRVNVLTVLMIVEGVGLLLMITVGVVSGDPIPGHAALLNAAAAGISGVAGLGLFYRALAVGTMSIVAPVAASGAALPALYGVLRGDAMSVLLAVGLVVAMAGVVLSSLEAEHEAGAAAPRSSARVSLVLAGCAAVGFGGYFILFDRISDDDSVFWAVAAARATPVALLALALVVTGSRLPQGRDRLALAATGAVDAAATVLYGVALTRGSLSVVSVVGSLYPVTTVLLARVVLAERVRAVQGAGIVLALTGVALISAG